jgi:hypothetical protein
MWDTQPKVILILLEVTGITTMIIMNIRDKI